MATRKTVGSPKGGERLKMPASMSSRLGFYVYAYVDPTNDDIFYVGKGQGKRALSHLNDTSESRKVARINSLRAIGIEPRIDILVHQLADDDTARKVEAAVIDSIGIKNLTNESRGWQSSVYGRSPLQALLDQYQRREATIAHRCVLIRIPQRFQSDMSAVDLYDATRGIWRVEPTRHKPRLALAVHEGVIQEVYEIVEWFDAGATFSTRNPQGLAAKGRREFVGRLADDAIRKQYKNRDVSMYFTKGDRNPIKYVGCDD